ncbi:unnamed protein product [Rotaria sp. Silwood1]|nr:unnamed protein product [Rotaria sp. Silwood1]
MGSAGSKHRARRDQDWLIQTLDDHESGINCMALSNDSTVLATGSDDHTIRLWSTKTTPIECLNILSGHTDYQQSKKKIIFFQFYPKKIFSY